MAKDSLSDKRKEKLIKLNGQLFARNTILNFIGQVTLLFVVVLIITVIFQGFWMECCYA